MKTKEEILKKNIKDWDLVKDLVITKELMQSMDEYYLQGMPTEKEIEKMSKEFHKVHGGYHPDFGRGAKWVLAKWKGAQ